MAYNSLALTFSPILYHPDKVLLNMFRDYQRPPRNHRSRCAKNDVSIACVNQCQRGRRCVSTLTA